MGLDANLWLPARYLLFVGVEGVEMTRLRFLSFVVAYAACSAAALSAQDPEPQETEEVSSAPVAQPRFSVRGEVGHAWIHEGGRDRGIYYGFRLGLRLDPNGLFRIDGGLTGSGAGYGTIEFGIEVQPLPTAIVTPLAGIGFGGLGEGDFSGSVLRFNLGVSFRPTRRLAIRAVGQLGTHGGADGPHAVYGGLELGL
jgi:opacity protein-like surface antigen